MNRNSSSINKGSFSIQKKPANVIKRTSSNAFESIESNKKPNLEFITGIVGSTVQSSETVQADSGPLVIPLIRNNLWRNNPVQDTSVEEPILVKAPLTKAPLGYGLNKVSSAKEDVEMEEIHSTEAEAPMVLSLDQEATLALMNPEMTKPSSLVLPILAQNVLPGLSPHATEDEKFRHDMTLRPESASQEDYERIPVEQFGAALLRGMGWKEGFNVGKNQKVAVVPVLTAPRPHLLGLGATPAPVMVKERKYIKPGEKRVKASEAKPVKPAKRDEPKKMTLEEGCRVEIIQGRHKRKVGIVLALVQKSDGVAVDVETIDREIVRVWTEDLSIMYT